MQHSEILNTDAIEEDSASFVHTCARESRTQGIGVYMRCFYDMERYLTLLKISPQTIVDLCKRLNSGGIWEFDKIETFSTICSYTLPTFRIKKEFREIVQPRRRHWPTPERVFIPEKFVLIPGVFSRKSRLVHNHFGKSAILPGFVAVIPLLERFDSGADIVISSKRNLGEFYELLNPSSEMRALFKPIRENEWRYFMAGGSKKQFNFGDSRKQLKSHIVAIGKAKNLEADSPKNAFGLGYTHGGATICLCDSDRKSIDCVVGGDLRYRKEFSILYKLDSLPSLITDRSIQWGTFRPVSFLPKEEDYEKVFEKKWAILD